MGIKGVQISQITDCRIGEHSGSQERVTGQISLISQSFQVAQLAATESQKSKRRFPHRGSRIPAREGLLVHNMAAPQSICNPSENSA